MTQRAAFLDTPTLVPGITRFWLIRHALVEQNARMKLYGSLDVPLCPESLIAQVPMYEALAARLPRDAVWVTTPLSRTQHTAQAIQAAGYPATEWSVESGLIEQSMGDYHGLQHHELPERLIMPAHPFWPMAADEVPPGGESMVQVLERVGEAIERLADTHDGQDIVVVSHGGAIRAATAHALGVDADTSLRLSVQNLSLTILERHPASWRVVAVNELPGI
ncbi:histidine phosphatase family protein [Lichenicola cladoniae]|uniref:Histidine phosphatase family protein n=1 Tax=Lichenicola cladoniae TaxID=1484109 RepID=A0A6M8HVE3_9PROT|nr:histidine phosphatase family protein [Lichenicola cladoniae]NPD69414.1 histidine phosphatase family protein [Acetobacteraceae bacterium]QKE92206.1 histidine phosphatase family protein [Lichenicola cladoniae]